MDFETQRRKVEKEYKQISKEANEKYNRAREIEKELYWLRIAEAVEIIISPGIDRAILRKQAEWANRTVGNFLDPDQIEDLIDNVCEMKKGNMNESRQRNDGGIVAGH